MRKFNHAARRWCVKQARRLGIECTTATIHPYRGMMGEVVLTNNGVEVGSFCVTLLECRDAEGVRLALTCADCGAPMPSGNISRWCESRRVDGPRVKLVKVFLCERCVKAAPERVLVQERGARGG